MLYVVCSELWSASYISVVFTVFMFQWNMTTGASESPCLVSSCSIITNTNIIAHIHRTHNGFNDFLHLYISISLYLYISTSLYLYISIFLYISPILPSTFTYSTQELGNHSRRGPFRQVSVSFV